MELRWIASLSATAIHAADAVARGWSLVDPRLKESLQEPTRILCDEIQAQGLPAPRFWRNLTALAHHIENNRELVTTAIRKTIGTAERADLTASRLAECIRELELTVAKSLPQLVDDLAHRGRPIREIWESFGPGLLQSIGRLTEESLIVSHAEVVLVHPVLGGGGAAHLINNSVRFEAVLTNNVPQLPEAIRLGWLLAQLNHDVPVISESIPAERLPVLARWAMLPATLQAAQELDVARFDPETVAVAVSNWRLECPTSAPTAETVLLWWETYQATRPDWPVALAALDKMLFEAN